MKPFEQQTYYELLEIPVTAPDEEIRAAYARAIETYSPDSIAVYALADPGQVDALRARLTEAMEILTEPDLRAEYDRMIGVTRTDSSAVTALTPALAAAAQAVQPQPAPSAPAASAPEPALAPVVQAASAPVEAALAAEPASSAKASAAPAPEAAPTVETPAPAVPTPPVPEPAPAPTPARVEPAASPTPAVPATPLVVPGIVTPGQLQVAFPSYAISYVPVLVPAPSLTHSTNTASFTAAPQVDAPPVAPEAPAAVSAEPVSTSSAPAATVTATAEPVAEPAAAQAPSPVPPNDEEEELSGARAPLPSQAEVRPAASKPAATSPAPRERPVRPVPTPPPLPPGARRVTRVPASPAPVAASHAGKGSARPAQGPGMDLEEAQQIAQESAIATAEAALAVVAAKAREPRPKPVELPPNTEFNGEVLRQVRESRSLTLAQLAERTRISTKHLENVEADRYTALPATVYLRGILMNIARELGLDPLKVSRSYLTLATGPKKK